MSTTASTTASVGSTRFPIARVLGALALALLAYEALRFYLRDPVHYVLDFTPASFGGFWPNRYALLLHIAGGSLALLLGPFQLWSGLRRRPLRGHRILGRVYLAGLFVGGAAALYLTRSTTPPDFGVSLVGLAVAWWVTGGMAYLAIRRRQIQSHREWMIRSYVVTYAFVVFRYLYDLPILQSLGPSKAAAIGWICWAVPLLGTEVTLQWRRTVGVASRR